MFINIILFNIKLYEFEKMKIRMLFCVVLVLILQNKMVHASDHIIDFNSQIARSCDPATSIACVAAKGRNGNLRYFVKYIGVEKLDHPLEILNRQEIDMKIVDSFKLKDNRRIPYRCWRPNNIDEARNEIKRRWDAQNVSNVVTAPMVNNTSAIDDSPFAQDVQSSALQSNIESSSATEEPIFAQDAHISTDQPNTETTQEISVNNSLLPPIRDHLCGNKGFACYLYRSQNGQKVLIERYDSNGSDLVWSKCVFVPQEGIGSSNIVIYKESKGVTVTVGPKYITSEGMPYGCAPKTDLDNFLRMQNNRLSKE